MGQRPNREFLVLARPRHVRLPSRVETTSRTFPSGILLPPVLPSTTAPDRTEISTWSHPYAGTSHMLGEGGATPPGAGEPKLAHPLGRLSDAPRTRSPSVSGGASTPAGGRATPSVPGHPLSSTHTPPPMIEGGSPGAHVHFSTPQFPHTHRPKHSPAADVHSPHHCPEPLHGPAPTNGMQRSRASCGTPS